MAEHPAAAILGSVNEFLENLIDKTMVRIIEDFFGHSC
jgi:hypothetical protein